MKNKYRIKQEILKNGETRYTIQKKFLFWWKSYFLGNGYGSCMWWYILPDNKGAIMYGEM